VALDARSGFETAFPVTGAHRVFAVQALDAVGRVLGTSLPVTASSSPG